MPLKKTQGSLYEIYPFLGILHSPRQHVPIEEDFRVTILDQ